MKTKSVVQTTALFFSAMMLACDSGRKEIESSASAPPSADTTSTVSGAVRARVDQTGVPCPRTGRWALCSVEKRLEQSGFVTRKLEGEPAKRAGFGVAPVVYTLGRARLEVFIYPDEAALRRDVVRLDTMLAAPRGQANDWDIPPRFVRSANLAAVLLTRNEQQAERFILAITAGPPQPGA